MKWNKFTIKSITEAEDDIAAMLFGLGIGSLEVEDNMPVSPEESGGLFGDVLPDFPKEDHTARISFYTEADVSPEEILASVSAGLSSLSRYVEIGEGTVSMSLTCEEDWINNWKEYFHSFRIDDILIEPSWEAGQKDEENADIILKIDPGTAFGTGKHESTQLAIRALRKYGKIGDALLDIGTGSGILGIVALKSGASYVFGTDIDPNTVPAIADNLARNSIAPETFVSVIGDITEDEAIKAQAKEAVQDGYDIVTANIIAEILTGITPHVPRFLKSGGYYITSGILREREQLVLDAAKEAGLVHVETVRMGEWSGIVFQKPLI